MPTTRAKISQLSVTMREAYNYALAHGGKLVRYPGGYWARPGLHATLGTIKWFSKEFPAEKNFGLGTVRALISRGFAVESDWKENGYGTKFPIEATAVAIEQEEKQNDE